MAGSMPSSNRRTSSRLIKKTAKRPAARKNWEECDDEPSPHRIAAMFVVILTRIPGMTVPTTFSTGFKVSTVGFNCDIEKCPNVARRTARALICPVGALSTQQSHIVLYNCVDRIRSDEGSRLVALCVSQLTSGHAFSVTALRYFRSSSFFSPGQSLFNNSAFHSTTSASFG